MKKLLLPLALLLSVVALAVSVILATKPEILGAMTSDFSSSHESTRWIFPFYGGMSLSSTATTSTVNRVYLTEFESLQDDIIDSICFSMVNSTSTPDNVIMGVYGPIVTNDTPAGSALLGTSGTSTTYKTEKTDNCISLNSLPIGTGRFYAAMMTPDSLISFYRHTTNSAVSSTFTGTFDVSSGAPLPSTPGTITFSNSITPVLRIMTEK